MNVAEILSARLIGTMFVERGLLSESQIRVALEIQRETGHQLGQILVERFGVSRQELASVVADQWADIGKSTPQVDTAANESWRKLGEIFVERGFVTQEQLDQALERQRETGERVGEALVAQGAISKFELAGALAEQMSQLEAAKATAQETAAPDANVVHLPPRLEEASPEPEAEPRPETASVVEELPEPEREPVVEEEPAPEPETEPEAAAVVEDAAPEPEVEPEAASTDVAEADPEIEIEIEPEPSDEPEPAADGQPDVAPAQAAANVLVAWPGRRVSLVPPQVEHPEPADDVWVAFVSTSAGYRLVERSGPLPAAGSTIDLPDLGELVVLRLGRSPLPLDERACAFLEPVVRHDEALAG